MTNLENEIKDVFESEPIDVTSNDILKVTDSEPSFVSKKNRISKKESIILSFANLTVAFGVFALALIPSYNYKETIEDRIENPLFASHILSGLGATKLAIDLNDAESFELNQENIEEIIIPQLAYLNYTYTNKDKLAFNFKDEQKEIDNLTFTKKENIQDRFLKRDYDIFLKKQNDYYVKGFVFGQEKTDIPLFSLDIKSTTKNRNSLLDIDFVPSDYNKSQFFFNLNEENDGSITFSGYFNDAKKFSCRFEQKNRYNKYTITKEDLDKDIVIKIFNKENMSYICEYFADDSATEVYLFNYTFNSDGTIEESL